MQVSCRKPSCLVAATRGQSLWFTSHCDVARRFVTSRYGASNLRPLQSLANDVPIRSLFSFLTLNVHHVHRRARCIKPVWLKLAVLALAVVLTQCLHARARPGLSSYLPVYCDRAYTTTLFISHIKAQQKHRGVTCPALPPAVHHLDMKGTFLFVWIALNAAAFLKNTLFFLFRVTSNL